MALCERVTAGLGLQFPRSTQEGFGGSIAPLLTQVTPNQTADISSEEPLNLELTAAATPRTRCKSPGRAGLWRTYQEMQQDRLLSIAGGVSFFVLLAIFPAITALVSAYGLFFNPTMIANDIAQLNLWCPRTY